MKLSQQLIQIIFTICAVTIGSVAFASDFKYAIIIDAGSSGSRAHVFAYDKSTSLPMIHDVFQQSTNPGISAYADKPAEAGASLKPILDSSALYLKNKGIPLSQVSIRIFATGGMRLLSLLEQKAIHENIRRYIRSHYAFSMRDQDVRTISGKEEGIFDWLDVNYLAHTFMHPTEPTLGSIDMGGASTQIAFATTDASKPEHEIEITINGATYRIFSQSFLGLGQDQARNAMNSDESSTNCYPSGYTYDSKTGNFNFFICSSIYAAIIQNQGVEQSMIATDGPFIAYAGIYFDYSFFNILNTPTQNALLSRIDAICYLSWEQLQTNNPGISPKYLANYCTHGVYFEQLLYTTYKLKNEQLTVTNEINGINIDWTLGALLYSLIT
jgi:apyrase